MRGKIEDTITMTSTKTNEQYVLPRTGLNRRTLP